MNKNVELLIRQAQPTDYIALSKFFQANNRIEVTENFHPFPLTSQTAQHISHSCHQDKYYIGILGEKILGLGMLRGWDAGYDIPSFGLFVDYRYQGMGFGRQIMKFVISEAGQFDCSKIRASAYLDNVRTLRLHARFDFYEVSRESVLVGGKTRIKIVMMKDLPG